MLQIEYELGKMCREHRVDGRTTQADRLELAATVGRDLDACGCHRFSRQKHCSRKLKDKHVRGLAGHWTGKGLSPGTINNRLAFLRHVCEWSGRGSCSWTSGREAACRRNLVMAGRGRLKCPLREGILAARPSRDVVVAAYQEVTRERWRGAPGRFRLVASALQKC